MCNEETSKYITITVAEYVCLTKAAALLEVVVNDPTYNHEAVAGVTETVKQMVTAAAMTAAASEAGAAE